MNLNPFDLYGPGFLIFYIALCALGALAIILWQRAAEGGRADLVDVHARYLAQDPHAVAYLQGGRGEVIRVALVSLLERGLLTSRSSSSPGGKSTLQAVGPDAAAKARRPLDKAILVKFASPGMVESLATDQVVLAEAAIIAEGLQARKLLPGPETQAQRRKRIQVAIPALWAVAALKIFIALERGRTNILFLVVLALLVPFVFFALIRQFRTALGDQVLSQIQSMFSSLKNRRSEFALGRTTSEFTFLGAAFGLVVLPSTLSGAVVPHGSRTKKSQGGSSCSSSCAATSSCGSGSSCGGGCGGGCGGCGGG